MATASDAKKHRPSPSVVSIKCQGFKSFLVTCRPRLTTSKPSPCLLANPTTKNSSSLSKDTSRINPTTLSSQTLSCIRDGKTAAHAYWRRAQQLELELIQLNKWLNIEKRLTDRVDNNNVANAADLKRKSNDKDVLRKELMRHGDGGYLCDFKKSSRSWERLIMQISAPAVVSEEIGTNVSQVLRKMASMGRSDMRKWLLESMPINEKQFNPTEEKDRNADSRTSEEGFMEAIVFRAIENMKTLVQEGLRIQMGAKQRALNEVVPECNREERSGEYIVLVMLIQLRDREKRYGTVGDFMIGLVEASVAESNEDGFLIEGIHIAGMCTDSKDNKLIQFDSGGERISCRKEVKIDCKGNCLWSVSIEKHERGNV